MAKLLNEFGWWRMIQRIFAVFVVLCTFSLIFLSWKKPLSRALQKQEPIFFLLVGTDWVDYAVHADTILLARYAPKSRSLDLLSVPRDTKMDLSPLKIKRINEVYAWHYRTNKNHQTAALELAGAIQKLLFNSVSSTESAIRKTIPQFSFYIQVDYDGFKKVIDLLGGVEVTVAEPMHYDDHWGKLHIHFEPGKVHLNGQKALEYVRFRGSSGDYGRTMRQQEFLLKLLQRFKEPENLLQLPQIFFGSLKLFQTNLSLFERALLLLEIRDFPKERVRLMQLPGKMAGGYWVPDMEAMALTANLLLKDLEKPAIEAHPITDAATRTSESQKARAVTVEVWNASSKKGLALEVVRKLRRAGLDVVKWGNYESRQLRTYVRDQKGDVDASRALVSALNSPRIEVFTRVEKNPLVDFIVILGEDYVP